MSDGGGPDDTGRGAITSGGEARRREVWYSSVSMPPTAGGKLEASSSECTTPR